MRSRILSLILVFVSTVLVATGQTNTMTAGTTWEGGTWSLGHVPLSSEDVVISSGLTVQLSSAASCQNLSIGTASASPATLTVVSGGLLTVNGSLYVNPNHQNSSFTFSVGSGIASISGSVDVSPMGTNVVRVESGTLNLLSTPNFNWNDGTLTIMQSSGQMNFSGLFSLNGGTLQFDQGTTRFNGGFTKGGGTLQSNGNGEQIVIVGPLTANNTLTFDPASTVTFTGTTTITPNSPITFGSLAVDLLGSVTLAGSISLASTNLTQANLTVSNGTLDLDSYTADRTTAGGTLTLGNGAVLKIGGSGTIPDNYTYHSISINSEVEYGGSSQIGSLTGIAKYGVLSITGANVSSTENIAVAGSFSVVGASQFSSTMGMVTMYGGSSISNSTGTLVFHNLTIDGTGTVSSTGNFDVGGMLSVQSGKTLSSSGTVTMLDQSSINNSGTLNFSGLSIDDDATVDASGGFTVSGTLTVGSSATFEPTGTVTMNNGSSIDNSGTLDFTNLTIANSASVSGNTFGVRGSLTVNGGASFSPSGTVTLKHGASIQGSGSLSFEDLSIASGATVTSTGSYSVAGTFSVASAADFSASGLVTMIAGSAFSTSGSLAFEDLIMTGTGSVSATGNFSVGGTLTINPLASFSSSGTLTLLNGASIQNNNSLDLTGLTIPNFASVDVYGPADISGTLSVGIGSTLDADDTFTLANGSAVTNMGSLHFAGVTIPPSVSVTMTGNCSIAGTLSVGTGGSLDVTGMTTMNSGSISNSGTLSLNGLTIATSASISAAGGLNVGGALQVNSSAALSHTSGTVSMESGSSMTNSGSLTFNGLTIANGASVGCTGGFSVSDALTVGSAATFSPSGTVTMLNGSSISNSGSLTFAGLTIASSASVSSSSSFSISGNMSVGAGANFSPSGTVTFTGGSTSYQNLGTNGFNNVTLDKTAIGVLTLMHNLSVSGTLTLTAGTISTGSNLVDVTGSGAGAVAASNGVINGRIRRAMANNSSTYLFNDAATSITRASGTNPSSVTMQSFPNMQVPYGESEEHVNRYYSISATGGSGTWSVALSYRNSSGGLDVDERNSLTESGLLLHQGSDPNWTAVVASTQSSVSSPLRSGNVTATVSSFGEFAFGGLVVLTPSASAIAFGDVGVDLHDSSIVTVTNSGSMTLSITSASIDSAVFSVSPASASIAPYDSAHFTVTFAPTITGARTGSLVFLSNAPSSPDTVTLSGNGFRPSITSFTPASALAGGSITLSGSFASTYAAHIVQFGGVRGTVTSGNASSLTVTVPAGAAQSPITVTAAGLVAASPKAFVPVHPETTAISTNTFAPYAAFSSLTNATRVLASDVDGDGKLDLLFLRPGNSMITIRRNIGSPGTLSESSFAAGVDLTIRANAQSMALGDLNCDGSPDLCVTSDSANGGSTGVIMYLNQSTSGSIAFSEGVGVSVTSNPDGVAIGDLDGDGRNDVVVSFMHYDATFQNGLAILRNTSIGDLLSFSATQILTSQWRNAPSAVSIRDLNLDGRPEVLVTGSNSSGSQYGTIYVWSNGSTPGTVSLSHWTTLVAQNFHYVMRDVTALDFDGDGYPDPMALSSTTTFSFFRNNSGASFGSRQTLTLTNRSLSAGDLDGDGLAELLVANNSGVSVYTNASTSGTISFGTRIDVSTGGSTISSVFADLDGDGRLDIASANGGGGVVRTKGLPSEPSTAPTAFFFTNVTDTSITFHWSKGNGDSTLILLKAGEAVSSGVTDAIRYTAHTTYGSGTQVGTGNYVVASTSDSSITVYGLQPSTTYHYAAYAFNGGGDQNLENYHTSAPATGSTSTDAPLPVQMAEMSGEYRQQTADVRLTWRTASEIDNAGWEVERRVVSRQYGVGSKEKEGWVKIGFVEGAGTSTSAREYSFTDRSIFDNRQSTIDNSTRIVYRLKQLDRSGSSSYSHEVEVEVGMAPRKFTLDQNYPNPFNPSTTISYTLESDGLVTLKIYDLIGREVATLVNEEQRAGMIQVVRFDATRLSSGAYVVRLASGGKSTLRRIVLMK